MPTICSFRKGRGKGRTKWRKGRMNPSHYFMPEPESSFPLFQWRMVFLCPSGQLGSISEAHPWCLSLFNLQIQPVVETCGHHIPYLPYSPTLPTPVANFLTCVIIIIQTPVSLLSKFILYSVVWFPIQEQALIIPLPCLSKTFIGSLLYRSPDALPTLP